MLVETRQRWIHPASAAGETASRAISGFFEKINSLIRSFTLTDIALLKLCLLALGMLTGCYLARPLRRHILPVWLGFLGSYAALMVRLFSRMTVDRR